MAEEGVRERRREKESKKNKKTKCESRTAGTHCRPSRRDRMRSALVLKPRMTHASWPDIPNRLTPVSCSTSHDLSWPFVTRHPWSNPTQKCDLLINHEWNRVICNIPWPLTCTCDLSEWFFLSWKWLYFSVKKNIYMTNKTPKCHKYYHSKVRIPSLPIALTFWKLIHAALYNAYAKSCSTLQHPLSCPPAHGQRILSRFH